LTSLEGFHLIVLHLKSYMGLKTSSFVRAALIGVLAFICAGTSEAQPIVQWTFEVSQPFGGAGGNWLTNIAAEVGVGTASAFHSAGNRGAISPVGNGSAHSLSTSNWSVGDFYQFWLSTVGYSSIGVSFDVTSLNVGPGRDYLAYSTDGINFTVLGGTNTILVNGSPNPAWNSATNSPLYTVTYDLSSINALNNSSSVYFRVADSSTISANGGTVSPGAPERIDNFTVSVVPEPNGLLVLLIAAVGWAWKLRRARSSKLFTHPELI